jgi:glycosyltransferase involved in cell wall biosynthesis
MKNHDSKTSQKPIRVAFFHRKPRALGNFSIETYFQQIREQLPQPFQPIYVEMPYESNGLWRRLANAMYCFFKQEDINQITGDIHYVAAFLKKKKTVLTIHDCGSLHDSAGLKRKIMRYFWFTMPTAKSAIVTANSEATKTDIMAQTQCQSDKIAVVYICVGQQFQAQPKGFNAQNPRILQLGTAPNKNLERLIPAMKDIPCTLVIVGKVSDAIKALIRENNIQTECIERRLSDDEMLDQYHQCDILSLVSTLEGFGMPIVEANAVGRPVITSNTTSMPEIAADAAVLVDPFDTHAIREGFLKIIDNPQIREELVQNGLQNHLRFQPKQLAAQYAELYTQLLRG